MLPGRGVFSRLERSHSAEQNRVLESDGKSGYDRRLRLGKREPPGRGAIRLFRSRQQTEAKHERATTGVRVDGGD